MDTITKLEALMANGWNINIECKAKGREYEMTYEATAHMVPQEDTLEEVMRTFYMQGHAVGDTFDEVVENLRLTTLQYNGDQLTLEEV